jgi:hypothetical protein
MGVLAQVGYYRRVGVGGNLKSAGLTAPAVASRIRFIISGVGIRSPERYSDTISRGTPIASANACWVT